MKRVLVGLLLVTCSAGIVAMQQEKKAKESPCADTETQVEANACARYQHEQADAEMSRVYKQLMSELAGDDDKDQQKLRQAQLAWLRYRDANCDSEASIYDGGSIRPAVYSTCLASITQERTRRMRAFLAVTKQL